MKIAVCGTSYYAAELALKLHEIGAQVKIFGPGDLGADMKSLAENTFWSNHSLPDLPENFLFHDSFPKTFAEFWSESGQGIVKKASGFHQKSPILRLHKRFLSLEEDVPGYDRVEDLFRLVYQVQVDSSYSEREEISPEVMEKLDDEVRESLQTPYESFEDFDFVVTPEKTWDEPLGLGPAGALALNEKRVDSETSERLYYGAYEMDGFLKRQDESRHLVIVGSGHLSAEALLSLKEWLSKDQGRTISLVTTESSPYQDFFRESGQTSLKKSLRDFLVEQQTSFQKKCDQFEKDIRKWKELDPHERVKASKPQEPAPQLQVYVGSNVTSVDRLVDREGIFLTLEAPSFRQHNLETGIKVINADAVLCLTGHRKKESLSSYLQLEEPGIMNPSTQTSLFWPTERQFSQILATVKQYFSQRGEGDQ